MLMKGGGKEVFIVYDVANPVPIVVVGDQGKVLFFHFLFLIFYPYFVFILCPSYYWRIGE